MSKQKCTGADENFIATVKNYLHGNLFLELQQVIGRPIKKPVSIQSLYDAIPEPGGSGKLFITIGISRRSLIEGPENKFYCHVAYWKYFKAASILEALTKAVIACIKTGRINANDINI